MIELSEVELKYVSSYRQLGKHEYEFNLKNLPGAPWKLRIKAVKQKKVNIYKGKCSLQVRKLGEGFYYQPSLESENSDRVIIQSLDVFLHPENEEIVADRTFRR